MDKKLHTLKRTLIWGLTMAFGFFFSTANAQLSGSYTIDAGSATGGTNYASWSSLASALSSSGVSGPVTVTVQSDEVATATVKFNAIKGSSATNTVKILGMKKSLTFEGNSSSKSVIDINGADYLTIENLTIVNSGNYTGIRGIWIHNSSNYNTIDGNTIEFSKLTIGSTSSYSGGAYIAFTNSSTSLYSSGNHGSYNKINGNIMTTTNGNEEGPYAGIYMMSSTTSSSGTNTINQNELTNNTIKNFHYYGIWVRNTNGTLIKGNDISRDAVVGISANSTMYGIYSYYNKSVGRALIIEDNKIHDLPFKGAMSGISNFYGVYSYRDNYYGTRTGVSKVSGNTIDGVRSSSNLYPYYIYYSNVPNFDDNTAKNFSCSGTGNHYGAYLYRSYIESVKGNFIDGYSATGGRYTYGIYIYFNYFRGEMTVADNIVKNYTSSSSSFGEIYGIYHYYGYGSSHIYERNSVQNIARPNYGAAVGFFIVAVPNIVIQSNCISEINGQRTSYGLYLSDYSATTSQVRQNTLKLDGAASNYATKQVYPIYHNYQQTRKVDIQANIIDLKNWNTAYAMYVIHRNSSPAIFDINNNMFHMDSNTNDYWRVVNSGNIDFASYQNLDQTGADEVSDDPLLDGDFKPSAYATQNVLTNVNPRNTKDVYGNLRNMLAGDMGAVKVDLDLEATSTLVLSPTICSGSEFDITLNIKNNFAGDAKNVKVGYAVNGVAVREIDTATIASGGTHAYTFAKAAKFNDVGSNTLQIFLSIPDDNTLNDTVTFTTNVIPAPGGSVMSPSATATTTLYQIARPDITQVNVHSIYDFTAPREFTNATYGTDWSAAASIETSAGVVLPASTIVQRDASATDGLEIDFMTSDSTLEDEMLTLKVRMTNLTSGCDTTFENQIFIYPTIKPDFTFPARICDGDAALFENTSTVLSGGMGFEWDFGTGVATDKTEAPEPVFEFPSAGTYTVTLTAKTLPYGFEQTKTYTVVVNEIPTVNFTKLNACEGNDLTFTSAVTPASSILSWNFGDGSAPSSSANPTHQYKSTGSYNVTLSADLNGCVAEATQVAYQFDKPLAAATVASGNCDNEEIEITNNSTIANGNFGSYWDLDDAGAVSTAKNAKHQFSTPGVKNVKLTVITDFGCEDEVTVPVTVKESPKVAFTNTPACSIDPTEFSNLTPSVAGTSPTFSWNFSDGTSGAENPSHTWSGLGNKTVTFNITLDNGCMAEVSKDLSVGVQPIVNFDVADVCAGSPAVFDNQTTWPSGDISYEWDFGVGSSTESDPVYMYTTTATETYVVTLTATIAGGCEDKFTKQITVNEGPKTCDFDFANDYSVGLNAIKLSPTGGSTLGIDYTWILGNEGSKTSADGGLTHTWQNEGPQTVTMHAKVRTTGCECSSSKEIVSSSVSVNNQLSAVVFPNPSTGDLFIKMDKAQGQAVTMTLVSLTGAVVKTQTAVNNGTMSFDANNVSNGVYLLKMASGEEVSTVKVTLQH